MNIKNARFIPAEISLGGYILTNITHQQVNEWLQSLLLVVTIIATLVGIWKTLKSKR